MKREKNLAVSIYTKKLLDLLPQLAKAHWLFFIVLALGILARTWNFGNIPPGLNPDRTSSVRSVTTKCLHFPNLLGVTS